MKSLSIKWKLILIITSASIVALVLACTALLAFFRIAAQDEMRENVQILADIIGANSVSALVFNDTETAEETLKGLVTDPEIVRAYIFIPPKAMSSPAIPRTTPHNLPNFRPSPTIAFSVKRT
jgi:hypothetical protein